MDKGTDVTKDPMWPPNRQPILGLNGIEMLEKAVVVIPPHCHDVHISIDCVGIVNIDFSCYLAGDTFQSMMANLADGRKGGDKGGWTWPISKPEDSPAEPESEYPEQPQEFGDMAGAIEKRG